MKTNKFLLFVLKCGIYAILIVSAIVSTNYFIDASLAIRPIHTKMAQLALEGNIIAVPQNYNERAFQICIVDQMKKMPDTVVIGSSRGMFLGKEITGIDNLYNNCVSAACLEDDYALLGLYYKKYGSLPSHIIIEMDPWVLYDGNPEGRWKELWEYATAAEKFYYTVNGKELINNSTNENPYISISYFQYNISQLLNNGIKVFDKAEGARISTNESEAADYPDGTIRYEEKLEKESTERLEKVRNTIGACTYKNVNLMTEISVEKSEAFEALIDYLIGQRCEVEIYLQPFSVTQCKYSFDDGMNESFSTVERYLAELAADKGISLKGSYDSRKFELTDIRFIDNMHLDKIGTNIVWNYKD